MAGAAALIPVALSALGTGAAAAGSAAASALPALGGMAASALPALGSIGSSIGSAAGGILPFLSSGLSSLGADASSILGSVGSDLSSFGSTLSNDFGMAGNAIKGLFDGSQPMDAGTGLVGTPGVGENPMQNAATASGGPLSALQALGGKLKDYGITPGNVLQGLGSAGSMAQQRAAQLRAYQNSLTRPAGPMGGGPANSSGAFAPAQPIQRKMLPLLASLGYLQ